MRRRFAATPESLAVAAIVAIALAVRTVLARSDLPFFTSHDEANYIETALRFGTGAFGLASFMHGGLFQLVLFAEFAVYYAAGRAGGLFQSSSDFLLAYVTDPTPFYLMARLTTVACSIGVIWLSYAITARTYGRRAGVLASLFAAGSLLMVQQSYLALSDMPALVLLMLATYAVVRSVEQTGEWRWYAVAAVCVGLAAACKYHTGFGAITVGVAALLKTAGSEARVRTFVRLSLIAAAGMCAGFAAGLPQALAAPRQFYEDVFHRLSGAYIGALGGPTPWLFIFTNHLPNGIGWPLVVTSLAGLGFALWKRSRWDLLFLPLPLVFYLLFMNSVGFAYHLLPAVAYLFILCARLLDECSRLVWRRESLAGALALGIAVAAPSLVNSARLTRMMQQPSTKMLAQSWIVRHVPGDASIMAEGYVFTDAAFGPPLPENRASLARDLAMVQANHGSGRTTALKLAHYASLQGNAPAFDVEKVAWLESAAIAAQRPRYLVMTSHNDRPASWELFYRYAAPDHVQRRVGSIRDIREHYQVIARFSPATSQEVTGFFPHLTDDDYRAIRRWPLMGGGARGPTIMIWQRRAGA